MIPSTALSGLCALCLAALALPAPAAREHSLQDTDEPARESPPASSDVAPSAEALHRVAAILITAPPKSAELLGIQLALLGSGDLPALFETLRLGVIPVTESSGEERAQALSEVQEQGLFRSMQHMLEPCRRQLRALSLSEREPLACRTAVRILGEIGDSKDLRVVLDLARPPVPAKAPTSASTPAPMIAPPIVTDEIATAFEDALEHILRRDARGFAQLETLFFGADPQLQPLAIRAIASTGSLRAVEVLARLLGHGPELDVLAMTGLSRAAGALTPPFDERIDDAVRRCLGASSDELVREAALAAGKLEDSDAIPTLVTLLTHANRGVRQNAHWALKRISGLRFGADPKCWTPWLETEQTWWLERAPQLFAELPTAHMPESLAIVQEIARRRYPRHQLAAELAHALTHRDAEVRRLTCIALGQFHSRTAVPALLECLEDVDPEVRVQAGKALQAITGEDPPDRKPVSFEAGF